MQLTKIYVSRDYLGS